MQRLVHVGLEFSPRYNFQVITGSAEEKSVMRKRGAMVAPSRRSFQCGIAPRSEDQFVLKNSWRVCKSSPDGEAWGCALYRITNVFVKSFLALKGSAISPQPPSPPKVPTGLYKTRNDIIYFLLLYFLVSPFLISVFFCWCFFFCLFVFLVS